MTSIELNENHYRWSKTADKSSILYKVQNQNQQKWASKRQKASRC